ncbi:MAG TPA: HAD hydrolase family protein [Chitinophagaceae bacterium]|nr:HAD hydrolase family protein [Chitinophagaceae bacterium]
MEQATKTTKMVVFDLDTAILQERFIDVCAKQLNFYQALTLLRQIDKDSVSLTNRTASFLTGKKSKDLLNIAGSIPLVANLEMAVEQLRNRSYLVGIISDSYQLIAEYVSKKIKLDFCLANELHLQGDYITGEVSFPSCFQHTAESSCGHRVCKTNALRWLSNRYNVPFENCIVVGDPDADACMINHVGLSIPFDHSNEPLTSVAKNQFAERMIKVLLNCA